MTITVVPDFIEAKPATPGQMKRRLEYARRYQIPPETIWCLGSEL